MVKDIEKDETMKLIPKEGQTIEDFTKKLCNISEVEDVEGIYNNILIHVNVWDTPESLVRQYHEKLTTINNESR